jgi:hypothetical protein
LKGKGPDLYIICFFCPQQGKWSGALEGSENQNYDLTETPYWAQTVGNAGKLSDLFDLSP